MNKGFWRRKLMLMGFLMVLVFDVSAQDKEHLDSKEVLIEAYEYYFKAEEDSTLWDKAYELFDKIPENDTNYAFALLEKGVIHGEKEEYEKAIELCDEGLGIDSEQHYKFFINKGWYLVKQEKYDEAQAVYDKGLERYPMSHKLKFKKAMGYKEEGNYDNYISWMKKTLELNPYYANAHLELANMSLNEGNISQALMSYIMVLLIEPTADRSNAVLVLMNAAVSSKVEEEPKGIKFSPRGDDYSEIDVIIKNYAALQKGYKVKSKIDLPVVRQVQVMFEKLEYDEDDKGYWMQHYVPIYKDLWDEGWFETFSYHMMKPSANAKHQKRIRKNKYKIDSFIAWANARLNKLRSEEEVTLLDGKKQEIGRWYYTEGMKSLSALGNVEDGKRADCWKYYYPNGALKYEGCFDDEGMAKGTWEWYFDDGQLSHRINFSDDEKDGEYILFYESGAVREEGNYEEGKLDGERKEYHRSGELSSSLTWKNDERDGELKIFNGVGVMTRNFHYSEGKLDGELKQFYDNGQVSFEVNFEEGEKEGEGKAYYIRGEKESVYNYKDNKVHGKWVNYYSNGQISREGMANEGLFSGEEKRYFRDGTLRTVGTYDDEGELTGTYKAYDYDGKPFYEFEYKKGYIIAYKFFDKTGKVISEGRKQKGSFEYRGLYADGVLKSLGKYSFKGGKEGTWKFYDENGVLDGEEFYEEGVISGEDKEYYANGKLYSVTQYNSSGDAHGYFVKYYSSGDIWEEGWYLDDKLEGTWKSYYADGTRKSETYYINGSLYGKQRYYDAKGKLENISHYKDEIFYRSDLCDTSGVVYQTIELKNSTGPYHAKDYNGNDRMKGEYQNGVRHGKFIWYFHDGQVATEGNYFNGEPNGEWTYYYRSGKLKEKRNYYFGNRLGEWTEYHRNGKIAEKGTYENDMRVGDLTYYHDNGKVSSVVPYYYGTAHGEAKYYGIEGDLEHIRYYNRGKIVAYSYLGKDGKPVAKIPIENETAEVVNYHPNGQIARKFKIDKGYFQGAYEKYLPNGTLYEKTIYLDNLATGVGETYYASGVLKSKTNYLRGDYHGRCEFYHPSGKLERVENYLYGTGYGKFEVYNKSGVLTKTLIRYDGEVVLGK